MTLAAGTPLGPYVVVSPLGAGGMGEVYRARDARLERDVAVKLLPTSFVADPDRMRRFLQEARLVGGLNHPALLSVFDVGEQDGAPYIVTELLDGQSLRERLQTGPPPPLRKAVEWGLQAAQGLGAAHDKAIIHRDIKPENLFVTKDGRLKILDFGLAKLNPGLALSPASPDDQTIAPDATTPGVVLGSAGYMSPEQVRGLPADHRSDIFSLGAVLYELAYGRRAFQGASAVETMTAVLREEPAEPQGTARAVPPALARIIERCLEKAPADRFQSARDLAFALEALSGATAGSQISFVSGAARARRLRAVRRALPYAALGVGLFAAGLFFGGGRRVHEPPRLTQLTFRRSFVTTARFAPDGKNVVFDALVGARPSEVFTTQPGSPEPRSLGLAGAASLKAISPDGDLAIRVRLGQKDSALARMPLAGGAPRDLLPPVAEADWSPDGKSLAVVRWADGAYRLEYPVGRLLYSAVSGMSNVRVSPRGDRVAFFDHPLVGDNRGSVMVVDVPGGEVHATSPGWAALDGLAWNRDTGEIWFSGARAGGNNAIYRISPTGGKARLVYRAPGSVALHDVARGGRVLAAISDRGMRLVCRDVDGGNVRDVQVLDLPMLADLSADGKTALVSETGEGGGPHYATYLAPVDGDPPVRLGEGFGTALSPDGAWALSVPVDDPPRIVALPTGAGEPRVLRDPTIATYHFAMFHPDGKRIIFAAQRAGEGIRLFVQGFDEARARALTPEKLSVARGFYAVTPDGGSVVAATAAGVAAYPLAGGAAKTLPNVPDGAAPLRFSADGRSLFLARDTSRGRPTLLRYAWPAGPAAEIAAAPPAVDSLLRVMAVRIDAAGSRICTTEVTPTTKLYLLEGL